MVYLDINGWFWEMLKILDQISLVYPVIDFSGLCVHIMVGFQW